MSAVAMVAGAALFLCGAAIGYLAGLWQKGNTYWHGYQDGAASMAGAASVARNARDK